MYNDGGHNIWIVKTTNPRARKKTQYREREIEIAPTTLSELKELRKKKNVLSDNEAVNDDYVAKILADSPVIELTEEIPDETAFAQNDVQTTLKMTPRALFDILYESYTDLKWKKKRNALIAAFLPYYQNYGYKCLLVAIKQVLDYAEAINETFVEIRGGLREKTKLFD